jgi:hypothetical protein
MRSFGNSRRCLRYLLGVGVSFEDCPIATKTPVMGVKLVVGKVTISLVSRW